MNPTEEEQLAGDFLKNLLKNMPKSESNSFNKIEAPINTIEGIPEKQYISSSVIFRLKDLKQLIKGVNTKEFQPNDTINNSLIYPSLLNGNLLLEKIYSIFGVKSINEIYYKLMELFKVIYQKKKPILKLCLKKI